MKLEFDIGDKVLYKYLSSTGGDEVREGVITYIVIGEDGALYHLDCGIATETVAKTLKSLKKKASKEIAELKIVEVTK